MRKRAITIVSTLVVAASAGFAARTASGPTVREFEDLSLTLQVNNNEEELAVILAMEVAEEFLGFDMVDPNGVAVLEVRSAYPLGLGLHECNLETRSGILGGSDAYPEGPYRVAAYTEDGDVYQGIALLSHEMPVRPQFRSPVAEMVASGGDVPIQWYPTLSDKVRIEVHGEGLALDVTMPGEVTSFVVPATLVQADEEYKVTLTAVAANGNRVEQEIYFQVRL